MTREAHRAAARKNLQVKATDFENYVERVLDPKNASDNPEEKIPAFIPDGVSEDRINTVKVQQEAKGWRVEVEPIGTDVRAMYFSDPS